jgi:hypothetical protein
VRQKGEVVRADAASAHALFPRLLCRGFIPNAAARTRVANVGDIGLVTGTACGLDRWASIVGAPSPNASLLTTNVTSLRVRGLAWGEYYEVNVVAVCDARCLAAQVRRVGR